MITAFYRWGNGGSEVDLLKNMRIEVLGLISRVSHFRALLLYALPVLSFPWLLSFPFS